MVSTLFLLFSLLRVSSEMSLLFLSYYLTLFLIFIFPPHIYVCFYLSKKSMRLSTSTTLCLLMSVSTQLRLKAVMCRRYSSVGLKV